MRNWSSEELKKMEEMVLAWKDAYYSQVGPGDGWEFLCEDLWEDIQLHVFPYLGKLSLTKALDRDEVQVFFKYCAEIVEDLRRMIKERNHAGEV